MNNDSVKIPARSGDLPAILALGQPDETWTHTLYPPAELAAAGSRELITSNIRFGTGVWTISDDRDPGTALAVGWHDHDSEADASACMAGKLKSMESGIAQFMTQMSGARTSYTRTRNGEPVFDDAVGDGSVITPDVAPNGWGYV